MSSRRGLIILWVVVFLSPSAGTAQVRVQGGNASLVLSTSFIGQQAMSVVNTRCQLRWQKENVITKVTVSTRCPGQRFGLRVLAVNVSEGVAAPEVTLADGMLATDLVRDIPTGKPQIRTCTLQYTATATFAQGNSNEVGTDTHTVTYTIMAR